MTKDVETATITEDCQVANVGVKPPPFWKSNPALWFVRLEAQFDLARITVDSTKFNHVLSAMDSDILNSVSDIVIRPPENDKYETLKTRLIAVHSESQSSKIRTLLQGVELGDRRPSQLLSHMRSLAGDGVGEALLRSLWLAQLPSMTQTILAALGDDLNKLASVADNINDLTAQQGINSVAVAPEPKVDKTEQLELRITELTHQVSKLTDFVHRSRNRGRSPNYFRNRSNSRNRLKRYQEAKDGYCFYHTNFGKLARRCNPPCSYESEN